MSALAQQAGREWTLAALARALGCDFDGDAGRVLCSVARLEDAQAHQVAFFANPVYRRALKATGAGAVILKPEDRRDCPTAALLADEPYAVWARLLELMHPPRRAVAGVSPTAWVAPDAEVDAGAEIGHHVCIGSGARIGPGAIIGPGSVIETGAQVGSDSHLVASVYIGPGCRIGSRVTLHPGVVIGADGFGMAMDQGRWRRVPQVGSVVIGDDCNIGANTTIDRGSVGDTVLGVDVQIDNQVQIAHNVEIGDHTAIAGCTGIAGSTRIGRYCMIAGACGIAGHIEICDHAVITAMSTVLRSIETPGRYGSAVPARPLRAWQRILVRLEQLDRLLGRPGRRTGPTNDSTSKE